MNGRLDTLQAAILLCKMDLFAQELKDRAKVASWYAARLSGKVALQRASNEAQSAWGLYTIRLQDAEQRARVQASLKSEGIPSASTTPSRCTTSRPTRPRMRRVSPRRRRCRSARRSATR